MKNLKKVLALVLAVVMIMGTVAVASAKDFKDVKATDNYAEAIDVLSNLGIIDGFTDGEYKPEGTFTRAQAAKMVAIVHNAATNGKIKGQDGISDLYGNAQNAFTDCTGNWAVAYINYCRATGLLDGITRTTYAPNSKLTGVQWLKLMLTTLNFDTSKEGYLGAGWDIHVLNRANEIGLLEGMPENWKGEAAVTRGEAAQILYNALTAYLVEYGQLIKGYPTTEAQKTGKYPYKASFVSNEQVNRTDMTLAKKMGVGLTAAHDVFMRPGYIWSYGSWSAFYLKNAVKTYTGKVTACDVLVDLGYAKTSKETVKYVYYRDGRFETSTSATGIETISHVNNACEKKSLAGNGALTQVFKMTNNNETVYLVTVIDTFLATVKNVDTTKHGKPTSNSSDINVHVNTVGGTLGGAKFQNTKLAANVPYLTSYAANDDILVYAAIDDSKIVDAKGNDSVYGGLFAGYGYLYTADTKVWNNTNMTVYGAKVANVESAYVVPLQKAEVIESGKYTGRSLPDIDEIVINGEKVKTNCTYTLDEGDLDELDLTAKTLNFYLDQYGFAIGDRKPTTTNTYGIVDGIVWITNGASYSDKQYASASFVAAGADKATDVTVSTIKYFNFKQYTNAAKGEETGTGNIASGSVSTVKANNPDYINSKANHVNMHAVVKYSVDADNNYTISYNEASVYNLCDGRGNAPTISATNPNLGLGTQHDGWTTATIRADEYTVFTVKTVVSGAVTYTSYTGIANVPTIKQPAAVVAVKEAGAMYASFVYVDATNAIFAGSTAVAFVTEDYRANYEDTTARLTYFNVYINGVKTTVEADAVLAGEHDRNMFNEGVGLYTLEFDNEGKLVKTTKIVTGTTYFEDVIVKTSDIVVTLAGGKTVNGALNGDTINHTGATIYTVKYTVDYGTTDASGKHPQTVTDVAVGAKEDLAVGSTVIYKMVAGSSWMADTIFVFVED